MIHRLTDKQERFCQEYLIDANAYQAAIRAGYTHKSALDASKWLTDDPNKSRTKFKPLLVKRISEAMEEIKSRKIATAEEVVEYLTSVLRSETESEIVVVEAIGDGFTQARRMKKAPDERERLKAAELLGRRHGIFSDKLNVDGALPVVITGEDELED